MKIRRAAKDAYKIFRKRGWTYWDAVIIPTVADLESTIRTVLAGVSERGCDQSETGHFVAIKDEFGFVKVCLILIEGEL